MDCIIENEELVFAESKTTTYIYLKKANRYITLDDFDKCFLGENNKFVFGIVNETLKKQPLKIKNINNSVPFYTSTNYPEYKLTIKSMEVPQKPPQVNSTNNDLFVGGTAVLALLISAFNQIKQKKKQLEESKCCSESKLNYENLNSKVDKLISDNEDSKKTMYAEIYEHYKELKELKEDTELLKDVTNKLLDKGLSK